MNDPAPSPADRNQIKELFDRAASLPSAEAGEFLDKACVSDGPLRAEVESLLRAQRAAGDFLAHPEVNPSGAFSRLLEGAGTWIGPYRIIEIIGEGGFGTVYLAEQEQPMRRQVALKVIKPGMDTRQVIARFEAERQVLAMMEHPHIARVFDAGATAAGRPYFAMEVVRGVPITDYCDQHRLSVRQRLELFVPVCQAIQHAHQKGIIHRDIKPSNVLITTHDHRPLPKVIDFGIAKAMHMRLTDQTLLTQSLQFLGTPQYMSPEQLKVNGGEIDARADLYSLGALLYEMLAGANPFGREGEVRPDEFREPPRPSAMAASHADSANVAARRQTLPARLAQALRGELDCIIMKCIEKERERRYASVEALTEEINRYLHDQPILARPAGRVYRLRKWAKRHRAGLAAVVIACAALALGLIGGLIASRRNGVVIPARSSTMQAARVVELLPLIDPARDALAGKWTKDRATLVGHGGNANKLQIPYRPPAEYDFVIEFKDTSGDGPVIQMCPTSTHSFMWQVAWDGYGFEGAKGLPGGKRPLLKAGQLNTGLVRVRAHRVEAFLNEKLIAAFDRTEQPFNLIPMWRLADDLALGLGVWNSTTQFTRIAVIEITGEGKATR